MGQVGKVVAVSALVLAACTGGSADGQSAREVGSIAEPDAEVFLTLKATKAQSDAIRTAIRRSGRVRTYAFLTQQDALRMFRRLYADAPALIATTTAAELPSSFAVDLVDAEEAPALVRQLERLPGVDEVLYSENRYDAMPELERLCAVRRARAGVGDVEVFLRVEATAGETAAVRSVLEQAPSVRSLTFLTQDDALRVFRRLFADKPKLLRTTTAEQLPTSFRFDLAPGDPAVQLVDQLGQMAGVDEVKQQLSREQCNALLARSS